MLNFGVMVGWMNGPWMGGLDGPISIRAELAVSFWGRVTKMFTVICISPYANFSGSNDIS